MKNNRHKISYSDESNFVWFHTPKCGTRSMIDFLKNNTKLVINKLSPLEIDHYTEIEKFSSYFKFTFVRNPWSRVVSCWTSKIEGGEEKKKMRGGPKINAILREANLLGCTFPEFVRYLGEESNVFRDPHWHPLSSYLPIQELDFVGKIENLKEDLDTVCNKIGIPPQKLPHKNKTKHKHYSEYYNDETCEIIANKYAKDIEYFGYKFGE